MSLTALPTPDTTTIVIRVRAYDGNIFIASTPRQKFYRTVSTQQGFDATAGALLDRHYPAAHGGASEISPNDARVAALGVKLDRHDADTKETRWFIAHVEIAD